MKQLWIVLLLAIDMQSLAGIASHNPELFNTEGYRIDRYRSPTPENAPHGVTIHTCALQSLIEREAPVLLDVQAIIARPQSEAFDASWLPGEPRYHLPGSTWLPNVGYGELDARMDRYFRVNLRRLTGGDRDRPVVIYCVTDCWMSWNAVRRAAG